MDADNSSADAVRFLLFLSLFSAWFGKLGSCSRNCLASHEL
jgi:hypothetical protein